MNHQLIGLSDHFPNQINGSWKKANFEPNSFSRAKCDLNKWPTIQPTKS
ncbi:BnaA02g13190D [Brassica napus]|uniref:BnaA02g13190D protein n=1 Tax=Brassica napus TaxID=3708 RepID=A0A078FHJ2_BRANA|nr:BnaA02g13190D [Brassica napus]